MMAEQIRQHDKAVRNAFRANSQGAWEREREIYRDLIGGLSVPAPSTVIAESRDDDDG